MRLRPPELLGLLVPVLLGQSLLARQRLTEPAFVSDCRPCTIQPDPAAKSYNFTFRLRNAADGERIVEAIEISSGGSQRRTLRVGKMMPVGSGDTIFFGPQDIDFDGSLDLMLMLSQGTANAIAQYWLFDPKTHSYTPVGQYPVFTADPARKRLKTYERGGYAGRIYDKNEYAFLNGHLQLVRSEQQKLVRKPATFQRTIRERVNGVMKVTSRRIVSGSGYDSP